MKANYTNRTWLLSDSDNRTFGLMKPCTVVIHNTAMKASANNEAKYVHSRAGGVTYHFAIDDKEAIQLLPLNKSGWHAGDGGKKDGGRCGIAIEICYSMLGGTKYAQAEENAAHKAAELLLAYNLPISKLSKHQDWSGKYCPHAILSRTNGWNNFKARVQYYMGQLSKSEPLKQESGKMTKDQYILLDNRSVVEQEVTLAWIESKVKNPKLTCTLKELVQAFYDEGRKENVRPDLALCQAIKETGWWQYGGIVKPEQNNYGGLAAFNGNKQGDAASFRDCREGARASIQHLRGYATKTKPTQAIVDTRYQALIDKGYLGQSNTWHKLSGKWAYPGFDNKKYKTYEDAYRVGETYGQDITRMYEQLLEFAKNYKPKETKPTPTNEEKPVEFTFIGVFAEASADDPNARRIIHQVPYAVYVDISRVDTRLFKEIVQVGGGTKHEKATIHIAGANRFETDKEVTKWINQNL